MTEKRGNELEKGEGCLSESEGEECLNEGEGAGASEGACESANASGIAEVLNEGEGCLSEGASEGACEGVCVGANASGIAEVLNEGEGESCLSESARCLNEGASEGASEGACEGASAGEACVRDENIAFAGVIEDASNSGTITGVESRSLKRNVVMSAILALSNVIFPLISFPYVTRILLPSGTGRVSFATSVLSYFLIAAQLGIPTYGIREVARVRDDKPALSRLVCELFAINAITTLLSYLFFAVALLTVPRMSEDKPLFLISSLVLVLNCIGMEWLYRGLERYTYITVRSVIFKALGVIGIFLLIHSTGDYLKYAALVIFSGSCSYILNFINARKYISIKSFGGKLSLRPHLKLITVFLAMAVATTIYTNLDMVMLGFMRTDTDTGYYDAAVKIKTVLVGVVTSLGVALLPRSSAYLKKGLTAQFHQITRKAMNFVILLALPISAFFVIFARESIMLVAGPDYMGAVIPMQVIMFTVLFIGMSNITGIQVLVPLGLEKQVLISELLGMLTDLILNIILIPHLASTGAAIGTLCAEFVVIIYQLLALRRLVPDSRQLFGEVKAPLIALAFFAAAAGAVLLKVFVTAAMSSFIALIIGAAGFFIIYAAILIIGREPMLIGFLKGKVKN